MARPRNEVTTHCKYCGKRLNATEMKNSRTFCSSCNVKKALCKEFVNVCEEFKGIIDYEGVLRERRERQNKWIWWW